MFFTVGALLLALLVMVIAKTAVEARKSEAETVAATIDRVADTHESLERSVRTILSPVFSVQRGDGAIIINDTSDWAAARARLASLVSFAAQDPTVHLDMTPLDGLTLLVVPQNISYTHGATRTVGGIAAAQGLAVALAVDDGVTCTVTSSAGALPLNVSVVGINSSCERTLFVDPSAETMISVNGGAVAIVIDDGSAAISGPVSGISLVIAVDANAAFILPGVINVSVPRTGISRVGPVPLA